MAQKSIREYDGKRMLFESWEGKTPSFADEKINRVAQVKMEKGKAYNFSVLLAQHPWLKEQTLVVKPDQLVKRRGELGLIKLKVTWEEAQAWIEERAHKEVEVQGVKDELDTFVVEPFTPHAGHEEHYVSFQNHREGTLCYYHHEGGVHVGDVDSKAVKWVAPIDQVSWCVCVCVCVLISSLEREPC